MITDHNNAISMTEEKFNSFLGHVVLREHVDASLLKQGACCGWSMFLL